MRHFEQLSWVLLLLLVLAGTFLIYSWGFGGAFQFDDMPNLGWLQFADTPENALLFISSGNSGPLGRPIALASFYLLNQGDWPYDPAAFFRVNTLIHLLNGALVAWLFSEISAEKNSRAQWYGLTVASIWLLQPILVSTSLMAVQRMTLLSATFMLSGLILYVKARKSVESRPAASLAVMTGGLLLFGTLAVFTKENGLLLIGFVLVLEYTLLSAHNFPTSRPFKYWRALCLWLPSITALLLLLWKLPDLSASYAGRNFTFSERLQTEVFVLLDYIRLIFFPVRSELGPFNDDYPIHSDLLSLKLFVGVAVLIGALAAAIRYRKRLPYFSFAILWFMAGHSMESSVIPLEIYFEHRNYIPAIGIAAFVADLPRIVPPKISRIVLIALAIYCLELAFVLGQATSTWGKPMLAASLWHEEHPASERAALFLASEHARRGDFRSSLQVTDETGRFLPANMGLSSAALFAACNLNDQSLFRERFGTVVFKLKSSPQDFAAIDILEKLIRFRKEQCPWLNNADMRMLTSAMLLNPNVNKNNFVVSRLHTINATLAWQERDFEVYVGELEKSFLTNPQLGSGLGLINAFADENLWEAAAEKLTIVESRIPRHPLQKTLWKKNLKPLRSRIMHHLSEPSTPAT